MLCGGACALPDRKACLADITTALRTALDRAADDMLDGIAKEGLVLLRRILDEAGFRDSEYLKDYEVYSHIVGRSVLFEIVLDIEAVVAEDSDTAQQMNEKAQALEDAAVRSYSLGLSGPRRQIGLRDARRDARRPARDARRPARDARRTARDRLLAHEVANSRPRSARVTREGRLSVSLRRSVRQREDETLEFPEAEFQGILGRFMRDLKGLIATEFVPALAEVVKRYAE